MNPIIIAHRGASAYAPENTISAFRLARKMEGQGLEFDVQLSRDGVPVVIHDETLDRTTDHVGQVANFSLEELKSMDAGSWLGSQWAGERIPSLEQVLAEFNDLYLNIELKNSIIPYPGLEEKVIDLVFRYCRMDRVLISSFNHKSVRRVKKLAPIIKTGVLYDQEPANLVEYAKDLQADAVHPDFQLVSPEMVGGCRASGLAVNVWTVNEKEDLQRMIDMKVDGIITNHPHRLHSLLTDAKRRKWSLPWFPARHR